MIENIMFSYSYQLSRALVKSSLSHKEENFLLFFCIFLDKKFFFTNNIIGGESNISESGLTRWY